MPQNIGNLITNKFEVMNENELLSKAIGVFENENLDAIVVVDEENNYKGVLCERWIYRAGIDPSKTKIRVLCKPVPEIFENSALLEAAEKMLESDSPVLPVLNKEGDVIGVINDLDLLSEAVEKEFGNLNVIEFATTELITISKEDTIAKALAIFRENNISRAPVVDNGKVIGIVTMHDIITKYIIPRERATRGELKGEKIHSASIPVEEIMSSPVIYLGLEGKIKEAIELMKEKEISDVLIIENDKLFGIVTKKDLLEAYVRFGKVEKGFLVQLVGDCELIDESERLKILKDLNNFASKMKKILGSGSVVLHFKKLRGEEGRRYLARMRLLSPGKTYHVKYEGFNALDIVQILIDKMERIVISEKEQEDEKVAELFREGAWL